MKIGIDGRLWNETGVGRYIRNLVFELAKIDKENQYVLFLGKKEFKEVRSPGACWEKKLADVSWHSFSEQWKMPRILQKEKLDLTHFPYFNVPIFYNKPFVVTIHDLIITHFPTGRATTLPAPFYQIKRLGYKMALNHAASNSQKIIAVSEATKSEIVDHFSADPGKIVVTYESGDLEIGGKTKPSSSLERPYLLYVGNAHPHKNLERLLEAILRIKNQESRIKNLKLVLVGREDYFYKRLKKKTEEMGLEDQVAFYGEASDTELHQLYQNAQALILPSLMEGFGLPALEAMGQGCLVLASDIPSLREVCHDAAIYFDPLDVNEMVEEIKVAVGEGEKKEKLIELSRERTKIFSWQKLAKQTLEVYNSSEARITQAKGEA